MRKDSVKKVLDRIDNTKSDLIKFLSDSIKFKSINPEMMDENISELQDYQEWTNKKLLSWKVFDDVSLKSSDITQPNVIATLNNDNKGSLIFYLKDYHQPNKTGLFIGIHSTGVIK